MKTTATDARTDEELAGLVQSGDSNSFGVLVERYEKKLLRYGRKFLSTREDIEDIVQEVFMKAYQGIKSFDTHKRFSPWIYRIAHNGFVNGLKKKSRNPLSYIDFDTLFPHPAYEDPALKEREEKEIRELIDKGLGELDHKYREALILYYLEDMSYKDIAEILEVPTGTVGIRIKRGREALRKIYEHMDHHERA